MTNQEAQSAREGQMGNGVETRKPANIELGRLVPFAPAPLLGSQGPQGHQSTARPEVNVTSGRDILAADPPSLSVPGRINAPSAALSNARQAYAPGLPYNWTQIELEGSPLVPTAPVVPMPTGPRQGIAEIRPRAPDANLRLPSGLERPFADVQFNASRSHELVKWRDFFASILNDNAIRTTQVPIEPAVHTTDTSLDNDDRDLKVLYSFVNPTFVTDINHLHFMAMARDNVICRLMRSGEAMARRVDALTVEASSHASILRRRDEMLEHMR
jgi:hypothetical protein